MSTWFAYMALIKLPSVTTLNSDRQSLAKARAPKYQFTMFVFVLVSVCAIIYYLNFRRLRKPLYDVSENLPNIGNLPVIGHTHWFIGGPESEEL